MPGARSQLPLPTESCTTVHALHGVNGTMFESLEGGENLIHLASLNPDPEPRTSLRGEAGKVALHNLAGPENQPSMKGC